MIHGMRSMALSRLRHDSKQSLLLILGSAIGLAIAIGLMVLVGMMQANVEQQILNIVGPADVWIEYPEQRMDFSAEEIRQLQSRAGVNHLAQALLPSDHRSRVDGAFHLGIDDDPLVPPMYGPLPHDFGPGDVVLTTSFAERLGVSVGDRIAFSEVTGGYDWRVAGTIPDTGRFDQSDLALYHLDSFRTALGVDDQATLLFVELDPSVIKHQWAGELQSSWDKQLRVDLLEGFDDVRANLGGLRTIVTIVAALGLLLSGFLTTGMMQTLLRKRRRDLALLRSIGSPPKQIIGSLLQEVLYIGIAAAIIGILGGVGVATLAVRAVATSLNVAYVSTGVPWRLAVNLAALGLIWMLLAVLPSLTRASRVPAIEALRITGANATPAIRPFVPILLLVFTVAAYIASTSLPVHHELHLPLGLGTAFLFITTVFVGSWIVFRLFLRFVMPIIRLWGATGWLATRSIRATQERSRVATLVMASGICLAIVAHILMQTMQHSFDEEMQRKFMTPLVAVSRAQTATRLPLAARNEIKKSAAVEWAIAWGSPFSLDWLDYTSYALDAAWVRENARIDRASMEHYRMQGFDIPAEGTVTVQIQPVDVAELIRSGYVTDLDIDGISGQAVISRATADDLGVTVGDQLDLHECGSPCGHRAYLKDSRVDVTIGAIIPEPLGPSFSNWPMLLVDWETLNMIDERANVWHAMIEPVPGMEQQLEQDLQMLGTKYAELTWTTEAEARELAERQFKERYAIFAAGIVMLIVMGFLGMINMTSAGLQTRNRELAGLRAVGLPPRQLGSTVLLENALFSLGSAVIGLVAGIGFAYLLAKPLNVSLTIPWLTALFVTTATLLLSGIVALVFARSASRMPIVRILSGE